MLSMKFPHLFLRPEIIITFLWGWEWSGGGAGATPLSAEFWLKFKDKLLELFYPAYTENQDKIAPKVCL